MLRQRRDRPAPAACHQRAAERRQERHRCRVGELHLRHRRPGRVGQQIVVIRKGEKMERNALLRKLLDIFYMTNDFEFVRGTMRVRGDIVEVIPAYENEEAVRIEFFGDEIEKISYINRLDGKVIGETDYEVIYPAKHFVTSRETLERAFKGIEAELEERLAELRHAREARGGPAARTADPLRPGDDAGGRLLLRHRELLPAHRRASPGFAARVPLRLLPRRFLLVIDESHVTVPQIGGMWHGDRSRQDDPGRARLPPSFGAGQPSADIRGMGGDGEAGDLRERDAGRLRAGEKSGASSSSR